MGLENVSSNVYLADAKSISKDDQPAQNDPQQGAKPTGDA